MRTGWLLILGALLASGGPALGQTDSSFPIAAMLPTSGNPSLPSLSDGLVYPFATSGPNTWASAESLLWWLKSAPLPPVLTTFAPGSPSAKNGFGGALGQEGTVVLSPDHLGSGLFVGGRFTFGGWLDNDQHIGLEASGFLLGNRTASFAASSNAGGAPALRVPFLNVPPGAGFPPGESSFALSQPGFAVGGQSLTSSLHFWGAEGNALFHVVDSDTLSVSLLGGFRYLNLREDLTLVDNNHILAFKSYSGSDSFTTRNQFYGGQLGMKSLTQFGCFDASLLAKVALGDNCQTVTVNGYSSVNGGPNTTGGIFAQGTNIGQRTRSEFCVVPEVQLQLGINLSKRIRAFVGYDFLYMSNAVRPGDQIDRTLNFTGNGAVTGTPPAGLVGASRPEPLFNGSGFWAQGINIGLQFRF